MTRLEDLQPTAAVRGILPEQVVTVVSVQWFGSEALELTYKGPSGRASQLGHSSDSIGKSCQAISGPGRAKSACR
jgi:hypothetical protein